MYFVAHNVRFRTLNEARTFLYNIHWHEHKHYRAGWKDPIYKIREKDGKRILMGYMEYRESTRGLYWHTGKTVMRIARNRNRWRTFNG